MIKILVTGGAGFVGSSLCIKLKQKYPDYSILAFDNLRRRGSELNLIDLKRNGIEFIHGDIRNDEDLISAGAFDLLIEASAEPSVMAGLNSSPAYIINNNLYGSINCLNACLNYKAKIIFFLPAESILSIKLKMLFSKKKKHAFLLQRTKKKKEFRNLVFPKI